jgi:energy-coupling factor transporter ATP-binding protein EcfA2
MSHECKVQSDVVNASANTLGALIEGEDPAYALGCRSYPLDVLARESVRSRYQDAATARARYEEGTRAIQTFAPPVLYATASETARAFVFSHADPRGVYSVGLVRGEPYAASGGLWRPFPVSALREYVLSWMRRSSARVSIREARAVTSALLGGYLPEIDAQFVPGRTHVHFRNGTVCAWTGAVSSQRLDEWVTSYPSYDFDGHATCPLWCRLVERMFEPDAQTAVQRWAGYLMTRSSLFGKILAVTGAPGSGKSTFARTLAAVVGESSAISVPQRFIRRGTALSSFLDKRLLTINEAFANGLSAGDASILAQLSGSDAVEITRGFRPSIRAVLPLRILLVSAGLSGIESVSPSLTSRLLCVTTRGKLEKAERVFTEAALVRELPGIFNWACSGLRDLISQGGFTASRPPVGRFIERCTRKGSGVNLKGLYQRFEDFDRHGISGAASRMPVAAFERALAEMGLLIVKRNGIKFVKGLSYV